MLFAWKVAKFVKSNAIVFCKNGMTMGVGAGQMSRLDSARIASIKAEAAKLSLQNTVVASDAFFPFRDGLDVVIDEGADIDAIAAALAGAKQFNGGQACICPDYVFVKEAQKAALVEGFRANVAQNLYADGALAKDSIAQIVNTRNFERVKGMVLIAPAADFTDKLIEPGLSDGEEVLARFCGTPGVRPVSMTASMASPLALACVRISCPRRRRAHSLRSVRRGARRSVPTVRGIAPCIHRELHRRRALAVAGSLCG